MNKNFSGHLAVIGANIIFGINYVVAKGIMPDYLLPRPIIFLRVAGATLIFWLVSLFFPKEKIDHISAIKENVENMIEARKRANKIEHTYDKAIAYRDEVMVYFDSIRYHVDKLEFMIDDELWPLPKYRELLFIR